MHARPMYYISYGPASPISLVPSSPTECGDGVDGMGRGGRRGSCPSCCSRHMAEVSAVCEGFLRASSADEGGEVVWFWAPWLVSSVPASWCC
jgi:hypothetical protein